MVIPYYCEDYPENLDDLQTDNDAKSPDDASNDATSSQPPQPSKPKRPFWHKKRFQIPFFLFVVCPLLLALAVKLLYFQGVPLKPSPETPGFVEPLTPDGNVDFRRIYEERQDAWLGPPEENGFRDVLQAFGPAALEQLHIAQTVRWEDFPTDKASRDWFANDWTRLCEKFQVDPTARPTFLNRLNLIDYLRLNGIDGTEPLPTEASDAPNISQDVETVYVDYKTRPARVSHYNAQQCFDLLQERPWTAKEFPVAARWLKENADRYAVYESALNRPKYGSWHFPVGAGETLDDWLNMTLPDVQHNREIARLLAVRANYRLGCGDVDGALDDWRLILRLSRHILDNPNNCLVESLVGVAIYGVATSLGLGANPDAPPTSEQWARAAEIHRETFGEYDFAALRRRVFEGETFFNVVWFAQFLLHPEPSEYLPLSGFTRKLVPGLDADAALQSYRKIIDANRQTVNAPNFPTPSSSELVRSQILTPNREKRSEYYAQYFGSALLPVYDASRAPFYKAENVSRLQTLQIATLRYQAERGTLPPAFTVDAQGNPLQSWRVLILPYINDETKALYKQIRLDEPWDSPHNRQFAARTPDVFRRPENDSNLAAYSVIVGPNSLYNASGVGVDLAERVANPKRVALSQALIVERKTPVEWTRPDAEILETTAFEDGIEGTARQLPGPANPNGIGPLRSGDGTAIATANGAVRWISSTKAQRWTTLKADLSQPSQPDTPEELAQETKGQTLDELILGVNPASNDATSIPE
ncbi:MAG: DUF1559 domain-containing protein [Thermoguttaceae bacterium]|nr:DUF1559 domain-containing protein [Thermoguttaceae bacterium]